MFRFVLSWFLNKNDSTSVQLVVKGVRGGKVAASFDFATASAPVRWRLLASELSTNAQTWFLGLRCDSSMAPGDIKPVGKLGASHRFSAITRTVAWDNKPALLQGWV
jgi:hypothetical protein